MSTDAAFSTLEMDADLALFGDQIQGVVVLCYENERPLQGLAGLLDWRFRGELSRAIQRGVLTGKSGECVYLPIRKPGVGQLATTQKKSGKPAGRREKTKPACHNHSLAWGLPFSFSDSAHDSPADGESVPPFHLILLGAGKLSADAALGLRETPSAECLLPLKKNLATLGLPSIAVSRSDFGGIQEKKLAQLLLTEKGPSLWIVN